MRPIRDRALVVCIQCHSRKVKCDLQESPDETCKNCRRSNQTCVRRNGVRKRRKPTARRGSTQPTASPRNSADQVVLGILSPTHSSVTPAVITPATSTARQPDSFIAAASVLSYGPAGDQMLSETSFNPQSPSIREAILNVTQAAVLPRPAMLQALTDAFFEHIFPFYSVVDRSDVFGPNPSILLQQAICLAASLIRHDQTSLDLAYSQYEKVKTLIHLNYELDHLVLLKTLCIVSCWSPYPTDCVTIDGPWHWSGMAIRLAIQMGLHKQSTYTNQPDSSCFRRIFWHLINIDNFLIACWGRPLAIKLEDCDVSPLTIQDFPDNNLATLVALEGRRILEIIGTIGELNIQKRNILSEEISKLITSLSEWQRDLPDELRLHDVDGARRPFHRPTSELFIYYFGAIILLQILGQRPYQQWQSSTLSLTAASCMASLYEEIHSREQSTYLLNFHGFFCMTAAVPLILCSRPLGDYDERESQMEVICSVLECLRTRYGGADLVLRKVQRLRSDSESFEGAILQESRVDRMDSTARRRLEECWDQLFPFPPSFCKRVDGLDFLDMFGSDSTDCVGVAPNLTMFDILGMDTTSFNVFGSEPSLDSFDTCPR